MSLVKNLYRKWDDFSLEIPHWEIPDEGISALWGPSGAGKTSVFRSLLGLEPCPTLQWIFHGQDIAKLPLAKKNLGVVFQSLELFPHLTAEENILFPMQARKLNSEHSFQLKNTIVNELQITKLLSKMVHKLSGGEQQRVAIARALVGQPQFLFLDEPFSSIDEDLKKEARSLVAKVIQLTKTPTLLITHDQRDVDALASHVFQIRNGKLLL